MVTLATRSWLTNTSMSLPSRFRLLAALGGLSLFTVTSYYILRAMRCSHKWLILRLIPEWVRTLILEYTRIRPLMDKDSSRVTFLEEPLLVGKPVPHHTHAQAASARTSANTFMRNLASQLGRQIFFYQMSAADRRSGQEGNRTFYWAKDVSVPPLLAVPDVSNVVGLVDVDYYVEMHDLTNEVPLVPLLLYTFVPGSAANTSGNYSFTFTSEQKLRMNVSGGAKYEHLLWSYSGDTVTTVQQNSPYSATLTVFEIDRRQVDDDHQIILLNPIGRWVGFSGWLASFLVEHPFLERLQPVNGPYATLNIRSPSAHLFSVARVGEYNSAKLPVADNDAIASVARTSKFDISIPTVESHSKGLDRRSAALLTEYHRSLVPAKAPFVYPVEMGVRRVQFSPARYDQTAVPLLKAFMSPLVPNCYVHDNTRANEERAVAGRVTEVAQDVDADARMLGYMKEFVDLLIPVPHVGRPTDMDEVATRQCRPSQRRIVEDGSWFGKFCKRAQMIKTFLKKEPYQKVTDPRIISTIHGREKIRYSAYTYAFAEHMKNISWYAFGKTPKQIAERVAQLCREAKRSGTKSDLSRFDGHLAQVFRRLEKMAHTRYFALEFTSEVVELHRSQFSRTAVTTLGVKYQTKWSRLSGSPETSLFNSIDGCFIAYLALRTTRVNGSYPTPEEAWNQLGIYGGDDGFTCDLPAAEFTRAAKMLGQEATAEDVMRGEPGVMFLSRRYSPEVWYGDRNSCCDIKRQLAKLHVCVSLPQEVTAEEKLLEKCRGYYLTDRHTPVIGDFATAVMYASMGYDARFQQDRFVPVDDAEILQTAEVRAFGVDAHDGVRGYYGLVPGADQFPNEVGDWAGFYFREQLPDADWRRFAVWLHNAYQESMRLRESRPRWEHFGYLVPFLKAPAMVDIEAPEVKQPAVVDDRRIDPEPKAEVQPPAQTKRARKTGGERTARRSEPGPSKVEEQPGPKRKRTRSRKPKAAGADPGPSSTKGKEAAPERSANSAAARKSSPRGPKGAPRDA